MYQGEEGSEHARMNLLSKTQNPPAKFSGGENGKHFIICGDKECGIEKYITIAEKS